MVQVASKVQIMFNDKFNNFSPQYFRAFWSEDIKGLTPSLEHKYDRIHCNNDDKTTTKNIWDCQTELSTGKCMTGVEAAAVACQAVPATIPPCMNNSSYINNTVIRMQYKTNFKLV